MSTEHLEQGDLAGLADRAVSVIGTIFMVAVPAVLVVMMGLVGIALFVKMGGDKVEEGPVAAVATPPPAEASAPADAVAAAVTEGDAPPAPTGEFEIDPEVMSLGRTSYMVCAACHGMDGKGIQAGPALMAPSLVDSEMLLSEDTDPLILVVLKGIAKETMDYMGVMAPLEAALDDEKLAAVLTFTRNSWGNSAPPVTVEEAAAARARYADIVSPAGVKRGEVEELVEARR